MSKEFSLESDFQFLLGLLPKDWDAKAKALGALTRCRKIPNAEILLRVLLIHLAEGCSLRETSLRAKESEIISLSDVAIMDRLRQSGDWFQWMNTELMKNWTLRQADVVFDGQWNIRLIDGTCIKEPGPTGSSWRIHYSINLPNLNCDEFLVHHQKGKGETFKNFTVKKGDLLIGDRVYGVRPSIFHVKKHQGHVITRFALSNLPLLTPDGERFQLLEYLRTLQPNQIGDWDVMLENDEKERCSGRVCAIRKSNQAAQRALKRLKYKSKKSGYKKIKKETIESSKYFFIFTTLSRDQVKKKNVLELYRARWQIELVFKRLKSIMQLGHLRKYDKDASIAWLHGKLFVAFVIQTLISHAETFFPWGYPICKDLQ